MLFETLKVRRSINTIEAIESKTTVLVYTRIKKVNLSDYNVNMLLLLEIRKCVVVRVLCLCPQSMQSQRGAHNVSCRLVLSAGPIIFEIRPIIGTEMEARQADYLDVH